jgi:hypothetical protein
MATYLSVCIILIGLSNCVGTFGYKIVGWGLLIAAMCMLIMGYCLRYYLTDAIGIKVVPSDESSNDRK